MKNWLNLLYGLKTLANLKAQQRDQLIMEFGILVQPLVELTESQNPPNRQEYRIAIAKIQSGYDAWRSTAYTLCSFADDIFFDEEYKKITFVISRLLQIINEYLNRSSLKNNLEQLQKHSRNSLEYIKEWFFRHLSDIPIEWEPEIFPANTPFTTYLKIKESLDIVDERVHYFDRYLKRDFFEMFLGKVNRNKEIKLITTTGNDNFGINGVRAISELVRREFSNYQLIEVSHHDLHDRNLRVDDLVFNLGPGVDRAGLCLSNFGPADNSEVALQCLDEIIVNGNIIHQS